MYWVPVLCNAGIDTRNVYCQKLQNVSPGRSFDEEANFPCWKMLLYSSVFGFRLIPIGTRRQVEDNEHRNWFSLQTELVSIAMSDRKRPDEVETGGYLWFVAEDRSKSPAQREIRDAASLAKAVKCGENDHLSRDR